MSYYNDNDPKTCAWLRELIKEKLIPDGRVDERSILDVRPNDLDGFTQCHFFAGIGGWSYALRLAGWPADRPVWTGSCPCQPFSVAGKRKGTSDVRHVWPEFKRLIADCKPPVVIGEQVASADGRDWLAGVRADLEALGYEVGGADLCAAGVGEKNSKIIQDSTAYIRELAEIARCRGLLDLAGQLDNFAAYVAGLIVGAPHIRQRLFWLAESKGDKSHRCRDARTGWGEFTDGRADDRLALPAGEQIDAIATRGLHAEPCGDGIDGGVADADCRRLQIGRPECNSPFGNAGNENVRPKTPELCANDLLVNANGSGRGEQRGAVAVVARQPGTERAGAWSDYEIILCADGKSRRIESGSQPLAHGIPGRVGLLRGYGNAIVPEVAAEFIKAYLEIE